MRKMGDGFPSFPSPYEEKLKVGYKWYDAEHKAVTFPFGFGMSYTTFSYSGLTSKITAAGITVHFTVKNTGTRGGDEIAEVYAELPATAGEPPHRLVGWSRLSLAPGEYKEASVTISRRMLSTFDETHNDWSLVPGKYALLVGSSSRVINLQTALSLR